MEANRFVVAWGVACASVIGLGMMGTAAGQTREDCNIELSVAEQRYRNGAFDEAIRLIAACLDRSRVAPEQAVRAYRMLTLAHLKRDEVTAARSAIINLLGTNPHYVPDPIEEPPVYVSMVSLVRRELHLGPSALPIREVELLPPSSAVVHVEVARSLSLPGQWDGLQTAEGRGKRRQQRGW